MKKILEDRSFKIAIIISILFLGTGFVFLHFEMIAYGWAFFIILPIVLGVSIGALPNKKTAYAGAFMGALIFFILLLAGNLEGFICVLMALPIMFTKTCLIRFSSPTKNFGTELSRFTPKNLN